MRKALMFAALLGAGGCSVVPSSPGPAPDARAPAATVASERGKGGQDSRSQRRRLRLEARDYARLQAVFRPIASAVGGACASGDVLSAGPVPVTEADFPAPIRAEARAVLGVDEQLRFIEVVASTPIAAAGITPGDAIVAVDGAALQAGTEGGSQYARALADAGAGRRAYTLTIARGDTRFEVAIRPVPICLADVIPWMDDEPMVAKLDGAWLWVPHGLLAELDDVQLAAIVSYHLGKRVHRYRAGAARVSADAYADRFAIAMFGVLGLDPASLLDDRRLGLPGRSASVSELRASYDAVRRAAGRGATVRAELVPGDTLTFDLAAAPSFDAATTTIAYRADASVRPHRPSTAAVTSPAAAAPSAAGLAAPMPAAASTALPSASAPPNLDADGRAAYHAFLALPMPRAFVIASNGLWGMSWGVPDPEAAARMACQIDAAARCLTYALDERVVWESR
ncbi:MAG: hypothetical protein R3E87_14420 [Burkholderiaceae bacterium]